jgi:TPP-dependent pyruvate/acetoin dehydrogenase alpha subunit
VEEASAGEDEIKGIEDRVKAEIEDAVRFAEESPPADRYMDFTIKE